MTSKPYEEWQPLQCPPQLQRGGLGAFESTSGKLKDGIVDRMQEATTAGFPDLGPSDALPLIGEERGLARVAGETEPNYRERLRTAPDTWVEAGSIPGLLKAINRAGFPAAGNVFLLEESGYYHQLVLGSVVTNPLGVLVTTGRPGLFIDGRVLNTRFALLFDTDHAAVDPSTEEGAASIAGLLDLINTWTPPDTSLWQIVVIISGRLWGWPPTTTWGQAALTWGGNSARYIFADGSYEVRGP